jgi:hypothetical protein
MHINVKGFKNVLRKATLNFSLDSVQLNISRDKVKAKMIMPHANNAIVILDMPNDIIPSIREDVEFNFQEPNKTLIPYLSLIDDEDATDIIIEPQKIILATGNQKSNIFFCSPMVVSIFDRDRVRGNTAYFTEFEITDEFLKQYAMIKKIGAGFGKIYFAVENKVFIMETTDRSNMYAGGLRFELHEVNEPDLSMCFDYRNFTNVMSAIGEDYGSFKVSLAFIRDAGMGLAYFSKDDASEKYYVMSTSDTT